VDPAGWRPKPGEIPTTPGVYRFRDANGRVIYVGKAKNLRARLSSYFQDLRALHERTYRMITSAQSVDWTVVGTEVEALQLEYTWIKEYDPRFNVDYKDDKSYPWLAVTVGEEFPRVQVMRGAKRSGVRYFGPYSHAWAIRDTVDTLLRVFPMRSCSTGVFKRAEQTGRPCLLGDIGKCVAPCVGRVSAEEHRAVVESFMAFLSGRDTVLVARLKREMRAASEAEQYERAAILRDDLAAIDRALERQAVVLPDGTDADVLAFAEDPLEIAVQVFHVRGGRIRGQRGWVAEKTEDSGVGEHLQRAVMTLYEGAGSSDIPRDLLVPILPADADVLAALLTDQRGGPVDIRVPHRGAKRALMGTVEQNARQALTRHKMKRSTDLTSRSRALEELQSALGLPEAPLRIECFDVSNLQETNAVASMVVFEDALPRKGEYRRFTIRSQGQSDVAAMREVIDRRVARLGDSGDSSEERKSFHYAPGLIVVDGGPPQVAAAKEALNDRGVDIPLAGLAKRLEEVWLPGQADPVILPRTSEALYLLQRLRDEAHRFAIAHHRARRSTSMTESIFDALPGVGPARRKALLKEFGSVKRLRAASVEELASVPGIGTRTAESIVQVLGQEEP
jgi:excinuclease ABC subunit C